VPARIALFVRDGCNLCDEAAVLLDEVVGREGYERVDIDAGDELLVRYAHRIPVVAVDGVDVLEAPITGPDVRAVASRMGER